MAYTTINKSTDYFNTKLWTGNGATTNALTGVGFKPDLVWGKCRSNANENRWTDVVRGVTKEIYSDLNAAQSTTANGLKAFGSDGFTVGDNSGWNGSSRTYASWNWKASNSQGSSNTAGSINTAYTSVNTTAGFSISKYTGNGVAGATIGHGLGVAPKMIIVKDLENGNSWLVGHDSIGWTKNLHLNETGGAETTTNIWNNTSPTNQVFSVGTNTKGNRNNGSLIAYCFAEKQGYSKFGSYTGNGNANGTFVYTGFKPTFVMTKCTSNAGESWLIQDSKRIGYNGITHGLLANSDAAEASETYQEVDFLSNGFKWRGTDTRVNANNYSYIYIAFGQSLVGSNNVPCTAK